MRGKGVWDRRSGERHYFYILSRERTGKTFHVTCATTSCDNVPSAINYKSQKFFITFRIARRLKITKE